MMNFMNLDVKNILIMSSRINSKIRYLCIEILDKTKLLVMFDVHWIKFYLKSFLENYYIVF